MRAYLDLERQLMESFGLGARPVAVAFAETAPPELAEFTGTEPSGCSFWRLAMEGRAFYTRPAAHANCPVGSYTHNLPVLPERAGELEDTLRLMTGIGYLKGEEVPGILRLESTPGVIIYAPLGDTPVDPDVVLFRGRPAALMLLTESAVRAGIQSRLPLLARPTCMAIPAALSHGVVASGGCIGNRIYTGIGDDELYAAVPGRDLERLAGAAAVIASANASLAEYHRGRRAALRTE